MPELPEVENIRRGLMGEKGPRGKSVLGIDVSDRAPAKMFPDDLKKLHGQKLLNLYRRGKVLVLIFEDFALLSHLAMTGTWLLTHDVGKHDMLRLSFSQGVSLVYNDSRKFGWTRIIRRDEIASELQSRKFGPEPFSLLWNAHVLMIAAQKKNREIKLALLDQSVACGVGNIYASEVLFASGIHPQAMTRDLTIDNYRTLSSSIESILRKAIELGGSSVSDYKRPDGSTGGAQSVHRVYAKVGLPCFECGTEIEKIDQKGRSTFFCPECQQL